MWEPTWDIYFFLVLKTSDSDQIYIIKPVDSKIEDLKYA